MSSLLWIARRGRPAEPRAPRREFEGSQWLVAESPSAILQRIVPTDPLALERHCAEVLERRAQWIDVERLLARAFARVAREAMRYAGEPALAAWLEQCIARSIDELLAQDAEAARVGEAFDPDDRVAALLARVVGIPAQHARTAAVALNHLPDVVRRDFGAVMMRGVAIDEHARALSITRESIEAHVDLALRTLSRCSEPRTGGRP